MAESSANPYSSRPSLQLLLEEFTHARVSLELQAILESARSQDEIRLCHFLGFLEELLQGDFASILLNDRKN